MAESIATTGMHHIFLTVRDVDRSREFYSRLFGLQVTFEGERPGAPGLPPGVVLSNGTTTLVFSTAPAPERAIPNDRFDENRIGLDHVGLSVGTRPELDRAVRVLDDQGVPHGNIVDVGPEYGLCFLHFRDPDNIQLELVAPRG